MSYLKTIHDNRLEYLLLRHPGSASHQITKPKQTSDFEKLRSANHQAPAPLKIAPVIPQFTLPEIPNIAEIPQFTLPEIPNIAEIDAHTLPKIETSTLPDPFKIAPEIAALRVPYIPNSEVEISQFTVSEIPQFIVPVIPQFIMPDHYPPLTKYLHNLNHNLYLNSSLNT